MADLECLTKDQQLRALKLLIISNVYKNKTVNELIHLSKQELFIESYILNNSCPST